MKGLSVQWPTGFRWPLLRATRPREGGGRASSAQSPGAGIPRGRGQGGYGAEGRRVWSRTDCFSSFKKGRARGGSGEGKGNKKSYTAHFQQEAASASRGPDRHPSWVAQGGGESSEASLDPGAAPGSGNRISGRSRQRRPRGSSERNCNNPGQTAFV